MPQSCPSDFPMPAKVSKKKGPPTKKARSRQHRARLLEAEKIARRLKREAQG